MTSLCRYVTLGFTLALVAVAVPCVAETAAAADTREADAAAIHALVEEWSGAAQAKDVEGFMSVYDEDAVLMLEGVPDLEGIEAIREGLGGMMQDPNFALSFVADRVEVARSGDLAYETGTYSLTVSDPQGEPATQTGHYVVVWEKQADGAWKVVLDVPVSDGPPTTPSE